MLVLIVITLHVLWDFFTTMNPYVQEQLRHNVPEDTAAGELYFWKLRQFLSSQCEILRTLRACIERVRPYCVEYEKATSIRADGFLLLCICLFPRLLFWMNHLLGAYYLIELFFRQQLALDCRLF
ncbi:hypothetical protein [Brevibacillus nitrificans]|uniref:hypothetical protein n=1 Tax=Brevibacillus nitrificans TaxID=651560 RepID=UPI00285CB21B|nr:hypothetical protein [Brevibacillus nitrificans]MDR7315776.1 hypothetical protein [Brevibacillus nitrificans]